MKKLTCSAVVAVVTAGFLSGCTASTRDDEGQPESTDQVTSAQSKGTESEEGQSGPSSIELVASNVSGVPFQLLTETGSTADVEVIKAADASTAAEGKDFQILGSTQVQNGMPGPTPRVLLDDGTAFGSLMTRVGTDDITSLEQIPTTPGIITTDGQFTPLSSIAQPMKPLSGSNPDNLYFEAQHASASGPWVVWREGSAGVADAMPTLESDDWRLVAWNRDENTVTELGSAFLAHGDRFAPYASWDVAPSTDGKLVYFEASMPADGGGWKRTVISLPLDGSGRLTELGEGVMPVANPTGGAFWIDQGAGDPGTVVSDGKLLFSVGGDGWSLVRLAGSSEILVATVTNGTVAWLVVYDLALGSITRVVDTGSDWAEVCVWGRTFVWGNNAGLGSPMMYRADEGGVQALWGVQGLSAPLINANLLAVPTETSDGAVIWRFLDWQQ